MAAKKPSKSKPKKAAVRKPAAARARLGTKAKAKAQTKAKPKPKARTKAQARVPAKTRTPTPRTRARAKPATPRAGGTSRPATPSTPAAKAPSFAAKPKVPRLADEPLRRNVSSTPDDGDEGDSYDMSLLAGPRDVKPYIPKRDEQYMSQEQLEHFRTILRTWKLDLMQEVDRTVLHMKDEAANFPDPNDRATQESEFSLELRTRDRERKLIRKIDEALARIDDGTYGYCLETGEEIGIKRLEARPVATLSVEAQERRERRERQYGDRDDRYR
jgi:DnaK suppressor protein